MKAKSHWARYIRKRKGLVNDKSAAPPVAGFLWQNCHQTVARINVCAGQAKTSCERREGIDANGDDEKRIDKRRDRQIHDKNSATNEDSRGF
jgi:hypothetical protein